MCVQITWHATGCSECRSYISMLTDVSLQKAYNSGALIHMFVIICTCTQVYCSSPCRHLFEVSCLSEKYFAKRLGEHVKCLQRLSDFMESGKLLTDFGISYRYQISFRSVQPLSDCYNSDRPWRRCEVPVGSVPSQTRWVWRMIVHVQLVDSEDIECGF